MDNYMTALHQFLTAIGAISRAHVVTAAQNDAPWAAARVATLRGKFEQAIDEMDTLDPDGGGLRGGIKVSLPGQG